MTIVPAPGHSLTPRSFFPVHKRVPPGHFGLAYLPKRELIDWAIDLVDGAHDLVMVLQNLLDTTEVGFSSQAQLRTILIGIALLPGLNLNMTLTNVHRVLRELPDPFLSNLGIVSHGHTLTYRQITGQIERLMSLIRSQAAAQGLDIGDVFGFIASSIIQSSIRDVELGSWFAVDTTENETPSRVEVDDSFPVGDPRRFSSKDPEALAVHLAAKNGKKSSTGSGFELAVIVATGELGGPEVPGVISAARLSLPNSERDTAVLWMIDFLRDCGHEVDHIAMDKGYSQLGSRMLDPLAHRCVTVTFDMKWQQRFHRPDLQGAMWLDGDLACPGIPSGLIRLPSFKPAMPDEEAWELAKRYDEREPYMFGLRQAATKPDGSDRKECPARRGSCRCPLVPASMRLSPADFVTVTPPDDFESRPCCSQATISVPRIMPKVKSRTKMVSPQPRQLFRYGCSTWLSAWRLRPKVEAAFAGLRVHFGALRRGVYRNPGRAMPSVYLGFMIAWANKRIIDAYEYRYELGGPTR